MFFRILLWPWTAPILAAAVIFIALPFAPRFLRPRRYRRGVIAIALALATFWPLQWAATKVQIGGFWEWTMLAHLVGMFISICLLTGGLEAIRRANNTPRDESWEFLRQW